MPRIEQVIEDLCGVAGARVRDVIRQVTFVFASEMSQAKVPLKASQNGVYVRSGPAARLVHAGPRGAVVLPSRDVSVVSLGVIVHELAHAWANSSEDSGLPLAAAGGAEDERRARGFEMDWLARLYNSQTPTGEFLRQDENLASYIIERVSEWQKSESWKDYFHFMLGRCGLRRLAGLWP